MRGYRGLVAIALLAPSVASAQTTTADGVRALVRGDYAAAVQILRPLAEDPTQPDPLATSMMATLYHSGHGVAANEMRACGLYLRAATPTNPLQNQSLALAQTIHSGDPRLRDHCYAASVGIWREPLAASHTLGTDHWVRIDHTGFVVGYKGQQHLAAMAMGGVEMVFLPSRHTQLDVAHPVAARRHFIEFFMWIPHERPAPAGWTLFWSAYEIIGADVRPVRNDGALATVAGAHPPATFSVDEAARIRVNGDGEAEWVVSGATPRGGVIPSLGVALSRRSASAVTGLAPTAASAAPAQVTTADGVDAFVSRDYRRAADILRPIAESWPPQDPIASFFMAMLYQSGRGVAADPIRACALYVRAAHAGVSPFATQASALHRVAEQSFGTDGSGQCLLLATVGFDHGFQPASFTLAPDHWITFDLGGASITYHGQEAQVEAGFEIGGAKFLPLQHTELVVGQPPSTRHFIEAFIWMPEGQQAWTLLWKVHEVVRSNLVSIASEALMHATSTERPPTDLSVDLRAMASLRVNDSGHAEWAVLSGPDRRDGIIESEADTRAAKERVRAREAADAQVDWTRTGDPQRTPALTYADSGGCANILLYGWSADRTEAITLRADKDLLELSTAPRTFDLARQQVHLELLVHVYAGPLRSWPFCTDFGGPTPARETWRASGGTVTIELSPPDLSARLPSAYHATVHIAGAEFVSAAGVRVRQSQPIRLSATAGWVSGWREWALLATARPIHPPVMRRISPGWTPITGRSPTR